MKVVLPKVIKQSGEPLPSTKPNIAPPSQVGMRSVRKPIIEREEVDARKRAHQIVVEAEATAQRIIDEATEHADATRQRGWEEGREAGFEEHTRAISKALLGVERLAASLEPKYIGLVRSCVEEIIGKELATRDEVIVGVVRAALEDARQQREILIRVNPADLEALRRNERRLLEILARANTLELREDAAIRRGGCVVATELGTIDASLERQLDALEAALMAELGDATSTTSGDDAEGSEEDVHDRDEE